MWKIELNIHIANADTLPLTYRQTAFYVQFRQNLVRSREILCAYNSVLCALACAIYSHSLRIEAFCKENKTLQIELRFSLYYCLAIAVVS